MLVALVSAAWSRFEITRLSLAQRARLVVELAERGIEATSVIVADDENLEIAAGYDFHTVEQTNEFLGRKFNDGIEYACRELEADVVVLIGSDDWVHVDVFGDLPADRAPISLPTPERPVVISRPAPEAIAGREIALVDTQRGVLRRCYGRGHYGVIPWLIPRAALEPSSYRPIFEEQQTGIDGALLRGLKCRPVWRFYDPHDLARVDFKSATNLNSYRAITSVIGYGPEEPDPWALLEERYDTDLVDRARALAGGAEVVT